MVFIRQYTLGTTRHTLESVGTFPWLPSLMNFPLLGLELHPMKLTTPLIKQILRTEQDMCPQRNMFFFLTRSIRLKHISKGVNLCHVIITD